MLLSVVQAQDEATPPKQPKQPTPTVADYVYAKDSERQKFDFWQAKTDKPAPLILLIHGGGWVNGSKVGFSGAQIKSYLDAGFCVASISYRFIARAMEQKVERP